MASKRERGPGVWEFCIELGRDENGKRRQHWTTFRGTTREAEKELRRLQADADAGRLLSGKQPTLGEWLLQWHRKWVVGIRTDATARSYEIAIRVHLIPALGQLRLDALTASQIQGYVAASLKAGKAARTIRQHLGCLGAALTRAERLGLIARNPLHAVEAPPLPDARPVALSRAETRRLLEEARASATEEPDTPLYVIIALALSGALRFGEVLGLEWEAVNLESGVVEIRQQRYSYNREYGPPKRRKPRSDRLAEFAVTALREQQARQACWREEAGTAWQETGLVCTNRLGAGLAQDTVRHRWYRWADQHGFPRDVKPHGWRHTTLTLLLADGEYIKKVQKKAGHANISTLLTTYAHVIPDADASSSGRLDELLGGGGPE